MANRRILIEVDGLKCEHCVQRLHDIVEQTPGLRLEAISPPRATVVVASEHGDQQDGVRKTIEDVGFTVQPTIPGPLVKLGFSSFPLMSSSGRCPNL